MLTFVTRSSSLFFLSLSIVLCNEPTKPKVQSAYRARQNSLLDHGVSKHELEFQRAKAHAFKAGVTDNAQFKNLPEKQSGGRNKRTMASDDLAVDMYRKRMRRF